MNSSSHRRERRSFVLGTSLLVTTVAVACFAPRRAWAAKAQKADVNYREQPNEGKSCASCRLFTPSGSGKGTCAVVEGDVSPSGWCMAYSPR
jgi:hypothetical protein